MVATVSGACLPRCCVASRASERRTGVVSIILSGVTRNLPVRSYKKDNGEETEGTHT